MMWKKCRSFFAILCCAAMLFACAAPSDGEGAVAPPIQEEQAHTGDEAADEAAGGEAEETAGPYQDVVISATVAQPIEAELCSEPVQLEMSDVVAVYPRYDLVGESVAIAFAQPQCFAVVGKDDSGRDCIYGGGIFMDEAPNIPLYSADEEYPQITGVTGGYGCAYFVERNEAAWRLKRVGLLVTPDDNGAAMLVDHGEGPAPRLISSDSEMVYAVETVDGYELRVYGKREEDGAQGGLLGVIPLPQDTLEPDRAFRMNAMGVTHVERSKGQYLAIAETLDGIQSVIASDAPMVQAQIGAFAVAWLDDGGGFCVYDPEADVTYRYGENVQWYTPRDVDGNGAGYLFGGKEGVYMMSWNLSTEPLAMEVYAIAENDGWNYVACAAEMGDINSAYLIRERSGVWQLAYVELNEAFG